MGYKAILYCDGYLQSCRLSAVKLIYNNPRVHLSHAKSTYSQNLQYDFSSFQLSSTPFLHTFTTPVLSTPFAYGDPSSARLTIQSIHHYSVYIQPHQLRAKSDLTIVLVVDHFVT